MSEISTTRERQRARHLLAVVLVAITLGLASLPLDAWAWRPHVSPAGRRVLRAIRTPGLGVVAGVTMIFSGQSLEHSALEQAGYLVGQLSGIWLVVRFFESKFPRYSPKPDSEDSRRHR